jgi:hypothetical protein
MSAVTQMSFFPAAQEELHTALEAFQQQCVRHVNLTEFINSLVASFKSCAPGSTIVAACPPDRCLSEILGEFEDAVPIFEHRSQRIPCQFQMVQVGTPSALNTRQMKAELLDRYRVALHATRIIHRTQPRFLCDGMGAGIRRTDLGQVVELLKYKQPSLVVVRDVQNFRRQGTTIDEACIGWRLIMDIASQSGIPHLICGTVRTAMDVIADPNIQGATELLVLRPYDVSPKNPDSRGLFGAIINDFDDVLPLAPDESLIGHFDFVAERVAGDPDRLRRWVIRALTKAIGECSDSLRWRHFVDTAPSEQQTKLAESELKDVLKFFPGETARPDPLSNTRPRSNGKPGQRKIGRDPACAA